MRGGAERPSRPDATVLRMEPAQRLLRDKFFRWQCRIRQMSVREADGRPISGMRPRVELSDQAVLGQVTTLILKSDPTVTAQLRHMVRKTHDPAERYAAALRFLAEAYYQAAETFAEEITALFGMRSALADRLAQAGACVLTFERYEQRFCLPCDVREAEQSDPLFQATYWHNSLFNPDLPAGVRVLAFRPRWQTAVAEPE